MEPKKIKLNIGFADLIVEIFNSDYPVPEVIISLNDGDNMQDIAVVRQAIINDRKQEAVECLVFSDSNNEDYTDKFIIGHHIFEETR